jgi:hypothetical protein
MLAPAPGLASSSTAAQSPATATPQVTGSRHLLSPVLRQRGHAMYQRSLNVYSRNCFACNVQISVVGIKKEFEMFRTGAFSFLS